MHTGRSVEDDDGKIPEKEFLEKVEGKIREFGGLLDIPSASMLVEYEIACNSPVKIVELSRKSGNAVVEGTVRKIISSREFEKDGFRGSVASAVLDDGSGEVRVVFWDRYAEMLMNGEITEGTVLRVRGYIKETPAGMEIHAGRRGEVEILDQEKRMEKSESEKREFHRISDLQARRSVNLRGYVTGIGRVRFFSKKGREGRVSEIHVSDDSGRIRVVLWDDKVEILRKIDIGSEVIIFNGFTRIGYDGSMEVHAGRTTDIEVTGGKFQG